MSDAELEAARREIERLRALVEANRDSALLQAERAALLAEDVLRRAEQVDIIRNSTSWRLTLPLRATFGLPAVARRAAGVVRREGLGAVAGRVRRRLRLLGPKPQTRTNPGDALYRERQAIPAAQLLAPRVLILADLTLAQCAKYRVWQKQAHLAALGTECTVLDWREADRCRSALQTHALVIFYRVPGTPEALRLIEEAKRLRLRPFWEADDLIFDRDHYLANRNLDTLEPGLRQSVLDGVALFRAAMLACERTIASTPSLAERMQEAGAGPALVIENALDRETLDAAAAIRARQPPARDEIWIAYGSGSKAHDADFLQAAPALARLLAERPQVRLRLIGSLTLPAVLDPFLDRIQRLPGTGYAAYLGLLGEADISLAPLEDTPFNDAKSNIKWLEAAIIGLPSVCSPRAHFRAAISDGDSGLLADDEAAWFAALLRLVDDPRLRHRIGAAAREAALARYAPEAVASAQVAPLVAGLDGRARPGLRVLAANLFFAPVSFGGATIVAEEMATRLQARDDTEMFVFTSGGEDAELYELRRYAWNGVTVFAVQPPGHDPIAEFDDPAMGRVFAEVLRAVEPDVVHFHAVQNLGAGLLRACAEAGIPYVVTVHDAWWLCARQFMVMEDKSYCFQTRIDLEICQACVPKARHLRQRFRMLTEALGGAALILSPSEAHRQLFLANDFDSAQVRVNHNGIRWPERPRRRRPGSRLRFGFVGGISGLKGYHLVQQAFTRIAAADYELILVDNTLKLGFPSIDLTEWRVAGTLTVVPPYTQDELDTFFDGLDVLLFPSQWKESFGLIVAEALARDVWVVVTAGGGAAEFVVKGENGSVIPLVNDPNPLREAIERLLADKGRLLGHVNRHKHLLRDYAAQAEELRQFLQGAALHPEGDGRPLHP